jgi:hypothetical protein
MDTLISGSFVPSKEKQCVQFWKRINADFINGIQEVCIPKSISSHRVLSLTAGITQVDITSQSAAY